MPARTRFGKDSRGWKSEYSTAHKGALVDRLEILAVEKEDATQRQRDLGREEKAITDRLGRIAIAEAKAERHAAGPTSPPAEGRQSTLHSE